MIKFRDTYTLKKDIMRKLLASVLCLVLYFLPASAMDNYPPHVSAYINNYYELAIREMQRSGIPASVTLAQGIHESSWGQGKLSVNSKNHFGIKCKDHWTGKTFYIEDDDYKNGKLIKSCFRVYKSVEDSYIDHTNFLVQNSRYQKLFSYTKTDYENWAKGLQSCGYATDKKYAEKLIRTIEKYGLFKYDYVEEVEVPTVIAAPSFNVPDNFNALIGPTVEETPINDMPAIVAEEQTIPTQSEIIISENYRDENDEEGDDEYEGDVYEDDEYEETASVVQAEVVVENIPTPEREEDTFEMEASTAYDDEVPAAVSIEDYKRQSYIAAPVIIEQEKGVSQEKPKSKVSPAPVYQYKKEKKVIEKAERDNRVSTDNNDGLFQLKAKPRVSKRLRD